MPFKSLQQARWMYKTKPLMAKEWGAKTDFSKLPEHVSKSKPKNEVKVKTEAGTQKAKEGK